MMSTVCLPIIISCSAGEARGAADGRGVRRYMRLCWLLPAACSCCRFDILDRVAAGSAACAQPPSLPPHAA